MKRYKHWVTGENSISAAKRAAQTRGDMSQSRFGVLVYIKEVINNFWAGNKSDKERLESPYEGVWDVKTVDTRVIWNGENGKVFEASPDTYTMI